MSWYRESDDWKFLLANYHKFKDDEQRATFILGGPSSSSIYDAEERARRIKREVHEESVNRRRMTNVHLMHLIRQMIADPTIIQSRMLYIENYGSWPFVFEVTPTGIYDGMKTLKCKTSIWCVRANDEQVEKEFTIGRVLDHAEDDRYMLTLLLHMSVDFAEQLKTFETNPLYLYCHP